MLPYYTSESVKLFWGNCLDLYKVIAPDSVCLTITSPPDLGKTSYGLKDHPDLVGLEEDPESYLQKMRLVFDTVFHLTQPGGMMIFNPRDTYSNYSCLFDHSSDLKSEMSQGRDRRKPFNGYYEGEAVGIPEKLLLQAMEAQWCLKGSIIWDKYSGRPYKGRPVIQHEVLYVMIKPWAGCRRLQPKVWNTRLPSIIKAKPVSHPLHPCPMPLDLLTPILNTVAIPGEWLLDPFMGIGTVLKAGLGHKMKVVGSDLSESYIKDFLDAYKHN